MRNITSEVARKLEAHAGGYRAAEPFPHVVIDDFLPEDALDAVIGDFPAAGDAIWNERIQDKYQHKLAANAVDSAPDSIRELMYQLNSAAVLRALEALTGEKELVGDPYFVGGGMHQIEPGGRLSVHADFNQHPQLSLYRRLNLIIYLNRDWQDAWGGHLELWDRSCEACVKSVAPLANRCVVFSTDTTSFHGHPEPLAAPEGVTRKSLALYYYSPLHPEAEHTGGSTRWRNDLDEAPTRNGRRLLSKALWKLSYRVAGLASRLE